MCVCVYEGEKKQMGRNLTSVFFCRDTDLMAVPVVIPQVTTPPFLSLSWGRLLKLVKRPESRLKLGVASFVS